ncbi:hypothetical protein EEB14_44305 [Rhodococcus sp. WS4]|nr:hypothetical protein EEB14_44305 [Rhodococcus sp. WS4]
MQAKPTAARRALRRSPHLCQWRNPHRTPRRDRATVGFGSSRPTPGHSTKLDRNKDGIAYDK